MTRFLSRISFIALAILIAAPAFAADGFELIGNSPRQKALGGADLADSKDAMSMSFNPAGIVGLERGFQLGVTAVLPERGYNAQGAPLVVAPGDVRSGRPIFPSPNGAYVQPIDAESAWGVVSYGTGGINTAYDAGHIKPPIYTQTPFGPVLVSPSFGGPYGGGFAGMDLQQQFISGVYARKFGNLSIGFAPTIGVQMLNVQGLKLLAPLSQNPSAVTDKGYDWAVGVGVRVGAQYSLAPNLRVAVAGSTPVFMTPFSSYAGLVADHGRLDAPAHVMAGVAYDVNDDVTVMADWKHIFYSAVGALGNPSFPLLPGSFGAFGGAGFGIRDTDSEAFGVEWRATHDLTLRAGYHHSSLPFGSQDVTLDLLAPGVTEHHISGGFNYKLTSNSSFDAAFVYGFKNSVSGFERVPFTLINLPPPINMSIPVMPTINPNARITTWLRGLEFSVGYNYKFDVGDASLIPSHF